MLCLGAQFRENVKKNIEKKYESYFQSFKKMTEDAAKEGLEQYEEDCNHAPDVTFFTTHKEDFINYSPLQRWLHENDLKITITVVPEDDYYQSSCRITIKPK